MAVGYLYDPVVLEHDTGQHPERPERLTVVLEHLCACELLSALMPIEAPPATEADLLRVHDAELVSRVRRLTESGGGQLDADTPVSAGSLRAAQCAAGASVEAVRAVLDGRVAQAYALVRPPGHHATRRTAKGFCVFCNVAIAAAWALDVGGLRRVAIVDFDVHHGDGVVDAFADDDRVLYLSTHEHPLYPFSGVPEYVGSGRSTGLCVNIALPPGSGDAALDRALDQVITPALRRFRPELVLLSAGYDAHWRDPLANLRVSVAGFGRAVTALLALADELCAGRMALTLEGGYDLPALSHGVAATFAALLGRRYRDPLGPSPEQGCDAAEQIAAVAALHGLR